MTLSPLYESLRLSRRAPFTVECLAGILAALHALDLLWKHVAIWRFFARPLPPLPGQWPAVTLVQPISRGASSLRENLRARARLDYPAPLQHLFVCDRRDSQSRALVEEMLPLFMGQAASVVLVDSGVGEIASKIEKMRAALPLATGQVLCFIDDDVAPRPPALRELVPFLFEPGVGAAFGLACYTFWSNLPTALMSAFVNLNALPSYVWLSSLIEPYTITGHLFALRTNLFEQVGGLEQLSGRLDDDHELARRLRRAGLKVVQSPVIYDVANHFHTMADYRAQMKRWFVIPRLTMLPALTKPERAITFMGSVFGLVPGFLLALSTARRSRSILGLVVSGLVLHLIQFRLIEYRYLLRRAPLRAYPALLALMVAGPWQILLALLADDEFEWRGQRIRLRPGGQFEVLS